MARKPLRECRVNGCYKLTREGYCLEHTDRKTERHKIYDKTARDKRADTFYHSDPWKQARGVAMRNAFGLCQDCLARGAIKDADMVHHIKALREYPDLALVQSNLRPLCNQCHGKY